MNVHNGIRRLVSFSNGCYFSCGLEVGIESFQLEKNYRHILII